jgi:HlyD family secretion protein
MNLLLGLKGANRWIAGIAIAGAIVGSATVFYGVSNFASLQTAKKPEPSAPAKPTKVTALGRLEPRTEVIKLSAPQPLDGDRVDELLVKLGDRVQAGQVVAVLDARDRLQAALQEAQEKVRNAQSRLAQVEAGAKTGEIKSQQATISKLEADLVGEVNTQRAAISRWQSEVNVARAEYDRFQNLYREGAESSSKLDSKRLALETAQAQLNEAVARQNQTADSTRQQIREAKATLNRIAEVRPVDVKIAQTEVDMAIAAVARAQADLNQVYIRAPQAGQILKIHTRSGEKLGDAGIADLGQTREMVVVAEVYQTDIEKVKLGQSATVSGQSFAGQVSGKVYEIGLQVTRQNVFSTEPGENLDRRVVEVKIRLDPESSSRVAGFTNLQVQTVIDL